MTSASKSAFITGFNVAFVPLLAYCSTLMQTRAVSGVGGGDGSMGIGSHVGGGGRRHRPTLRTMLTVTVSLVGLFLLSGASWNNISLGMALSININNFVRH